MNRNAGPPNPAVAPYWDRNGNRNTPERQREVLAAVRNPQSLTRDERDAIALDAVPGLLGRALQLWIEDGLTSAEQIRRYAPLARAHTTGATTTDLTTARTALERYLAANVSAEHDAPVHRAGFVSERNGVERLNFHADTVATLADSKVTGRAIVDALRANRRGAFRLDNDVNIAGYAWLPLGDYTGDVFVPLRRTRWTAAPVTS